MGEPIVCIVWAYRAEEKKERKKNICLCSGEKKSYTSGVAR